MNCHYIVVREEYIDDANPRTTFGIAAVKEYDGCPIIMQTISDVCQKYAPLQQLVRCCNELELELIHLHDVVEDLIVKLS
ncbi:MAG: hypothetical protein IJX53_06600 [Clostridia bacterium]|nr:hypothetical protein [Clostridia bacterium]